MGLVFSDILSRRTIGLTLDEVRKYFESSVNGIEELHEILDGIIGNGGKLIVFIDNLDRCSIDNALSILESIKVMFNAKNAKFVVAADLTRLERAWALKHSERSDSLYDGREHMEKIFQLILSLPPKVFFSDGKNMEDESANQFINYIRSLSKELPSKVEGLIASGFPPNPRKIKRALSLAFFIGKNMEETDDAEFVEVTFPLILIWSVATSYFLDLAKILKESPSVFPKICLIIADTADIGNLNDKIDNYKREKHPELAECTFADYILDFKTISNRELEIVAEHVKNDPLVYRFLKAIAHYYQIQGQHNKRIPLQEEDYRKRRKEMEDGLKRVIDRAGLISL